MRFNAEGIFGVSMIVLGIGSLVFRRSLVRWHGALWGPHSSSPQVTRFREIVQLVVGLVLLLFGFAFLLFVFA